LALFFISNRKSKKQAACYLRLIFLFIIKTSIKVILDTKEIILIKSAENNNKNKSFALRRFGSAYDLVLSVNDAFSTV